MLINKEIIGSLFNLNLSKDIIELIDRLELSYKELELKDRDDHILKCIQYLDEKIIPSGKSRRAIWKKGLNQHRLEEH